MKRAAALIFALVVMLSAVCSLHARAAAVPDDFFLPDLSVSESDAPPDEQYDDNGRQIAYFERVPMIPLNVEIPDFYQEVVNISGMYVFTLADGTVCKRMYGAVNGRFGWYEPVGPNNIVYVDSEPINIEDDIIMYDESQKAAEAAKDSVMYPGMLPPENGVSRITSVFGMTVLDFFAAFGGSAALLCLLILLGASVRRRRRTEEQ